MVQELRLFKYVNGINDMPFPNNESDDEQIVITSFTYNAQRMAATPTITASVEYPRCLDNDWDINVYATFNGEKYYIRQIPSSSKSNTSVMYKHDITLYSERFILENIYFVNVDQKEDTSVYIRCDLMEFAEIINKSLENSNLLYRVQVDSSVSDTEKTKETKDITLENVYLSEAIQEIYNQWEIPFYFEGTNIVVKDCSENITDVTLAYGADESLLSIKKNNANFRKITRVSGYGSDKNIPFYYPNWSQKGVIDATPLESNSILTKGMITISDMKKFDKKMPLNGNVKYFLKSETQPIYSDTTLNKDGLKYKNQTNTKHTFTIPFESIKENNSIVEIKFDIDIYELHKMQSMFISPTGNAILIPENAYTFSPSELSDLLYSPISFNNSYLLTDYPTNNDNNSWGTKRNRIQCTPSTNSYQKTYTWTKKTDENKRGYYALEIKRTINVSLVANSIPKGLYDSNICCEFTISDSIKEGDIIALYKNKEYPATINMGDYIDIKLYNISIVYPDSDAQEGWYLNDKKKINLEDIGISVDGTPDETWSGEGFTQEMVSKIPTAQNLMPSLYRNSIGERKFYNAINYPRTNVTGGVDKEIGEYTRQRNILNDNYKAEDGDGWYIFETLWTKVNQNEHIQEFSEIYPSITNVTNENNEPIDEILEVAFDDNDNNEVDEEGKYIHPYFYVRIPQFSGNNGFNLFDHKIVGEEMQVAMTSGDCAACNFKIMVKTQVSEGNETYEDVTNPIKTDGNGNLVGSDWSEITNGEFGSEDTTQQDSRNNSIWLVLEKDNQTFNETYPNYAKGVYPKVGDKFVLLNIDMPQEYVLEAEDKLTKEIIRYMSQNNSDKWNFDIDFSRIFLQENVNFYERLDENCKLNVRYNGETYNFYVNSYKYEVKANEALPKITVGLVDTITINRGITQNIIDGVMKAFYQMFEVVDDPQETMKESYLRKNVPEVMPNNMAFSKNVTIGEELNSDKINTTEITSKLYGGDEVMGTGFKLEEDANGNSTLTVDNVNVRKKLKATEFIIQQIQFQGGIVIQSAAAMECNQVETLENGNFKCYFDTKEGSVSNQFMLNDLARCQRIGYAPKYYWRKVVEVGSDYIVLSNVEGEYEQNSDTPSEGDIIVQMGNTTNTDRQSVIEMNTVGENSPSFIMYSDINSFSLVDKDITGIVYHPMTYNEDGTVNSGYPELYSYGSMYFGDRDKQNNFIQYQKNANGTYEMVINAKTTFQGGTSDLGTALDDLLNSSLKGKNLCSYNKILNAGFTYASGLQSDGSFKIHLYTLYTETMLGDKDMFGMEGEYLEGTQYTFTLYNIKNNATTGYTLYFVVDYSDGTRDDIQTPYNSTTFSFTTKVNKTISKIRCSYGEGSYTIAQFKLEIGATATPFSISPQDVETSFDARENILKNASILKIGRDSELIDLIETINKDVEYVISVENVILPSSTSETSAKLYIYDDEQYANDGYLQEYADALFSFDITPNKQFSQVITFKKSISKEIFFISNLSDVTFIGVKLAKGNKYTGWEGALEEQQTLITLSNAMKGTTDINGGLVLTNLIELKNEEGEVTAGINGLDTTQGGVNSALRFWAGAPLDSSSSAPFRVHDDGRVFGTHFYGFEPALEINNDNYDTYAPNGTLNVDIVGSKVLLNFSGNILNTSNAKYISLPNNERYIGAEIEIFNPSGLPINLCSQIPEYPTVTVDNFYGIGRTYMSGYYYYKGCQWAYIKQTCEANNYKTYKYIKLKCMPTQMILKTNDEDLITITTALPNRSVGGYTQFYLWTIEKCIE